MNLLRYYCDNWWKVENQPIWYLAGLDSENSQLEVCRWYFTDETSDFNGPYFSRKEAEDALNNYSRNL